MTSRAKVEILMMAVRILYYGQSRFLDDGSRFL